MNNKIDYNNLEYAIYRSKKIYNFSELTDPLTLLDEIKKGKISIEQAKNNQKNYLEYLNTIRKGNKNDEQRKTLANINVHFNARDSVIKFIEDYGSMILEGKKLAKEQERTGLKILTPNQMLKILPIALAQIKAGNNSQRLLNEIRQIVYSIIRQRSLNLVFLYHNTKWIQFLWTQKIVELQNIMF